MLSASPGAEPRVVERLRTFAGKGLAKSYGVKEALRGVDVEVRPGELVGLLGPNGAGKTTCFNVMVGLLRPKRGTVTLDGIDVTSLPMHERARRGLGYLPQEPSVFRKLTVRENLDLVFEARGVPHGQRRSRGDALLADFGIASVERSRAETLSGGERRRLEIARAIAAEPTFLLLDEPFTGVDPIAVTDVRAILIALAQKRRLGVLITDHNAREVLELCDRVYVIHEGTLLAEGTPQAVASNEAVVRVYLGDRFSLDSLKFREAEWRLS
ncbi:MAG: LPS export ABC transporter ATP-binding protein [Deltaproteobacteria bacterium]|nr:LPS export ABC transporter ATP-binding protein [Deltaproteobacteria bacterium]